jgi:hypothetical protein
MDCIFDAKATKKVGRRNATSITQASHNVARRVPCIIRHLNFYLKIRYLPPVDHS